MNELRFTHIGMNNIIQANRVIAVIPLGTVTADRYLEVAKKHNKYHNAALGRKYRSEIIMDDGTVIISCIKARTLMDRLNGEAADNVSDEEEEVVEDNSAISPDA